MNNILYERHFSTDFVTTHFVLKFKKAAVRLFIRPTFTERMKESLLFGSAIIICSVLFLRSLSGWVRIGYHPSGSLLDPVVPFSNGVCIIMDGVDIIPSPPGKQEVLVRYIRPAVHGIFMAHPVIFNRIHGFHV